MNNRFPRATRGYRFDRAASMRVRQPVDDITRRRLRHIIQRSKLPERETCDRAEDTQFLSFNVTQFRWRHGCQCTSRTCGHHVDMKMT